jgi:hypothetical protein
MGWGPIAAADITLEMRFAGERERGPADQPAAARAARGRRTEDGQSVDSSQEAAFSRQ